MVDVKLIRGDCLEIMPTLPTGSVDAVITDSPYGISYQSAWRTDKKSRFPILSGDDIVPVGWMAEAFRVTREGGCIFCFCRWDTEHQFFEALEDNGWEVKSQVIWDRVVHGMGDLNGSFAPQHDNAWFATKKGYSFPGKRPKSVYQIMRVPSEKLLHPTQKPLALMTRIVRDLTRNGETILDPFMGSGTTAISCIQNDRNFIGIEIDPKYYDIASKRLENAKLQWVMPL